MRNKLERRGRKLHEKVRSSDMQGTFGIYGDLNHRVRTL